MEGDPQVGRPMTAERFFITCPRGLEPALADEVSPLGAEPLERLAGGVACRGSFDLAYRVNLYSRLAGRVLWRVADGAARDETELYKTVLSLPWAEWFSPRHT